jgi:D-sedoheptulose 7-phosphate isomerase
MSDLLGRNIERLNALLAQAEKLQPQVTVAADLIATALLGGNKLLACGNGGSAADASHLTTEFVSRFDRERRPFPAISLTAHGGDLTAIGNDYDFRDLFGRHVKAFGKPGDVLAAFTTSGRSENVRRALLAAREAKMHSIAFLGGDGGASKGIADVELLVPSEITARIQEVHKLLLHTICEIVETQIQES